MKIKYFSILCFALFVFIIGFTTESLADKVVGPLQPFYVNGDVLRNAPDLAYRGSYPVGVRTLKVVDPNRIDLANYSEDNPDPRYDRPLRLEVWYPAIHRGKRPQLTTYEDTLGGMGADLTTPFEFFGRALRRAKPDVSSGPYPLVIVSHGYPGSRVLLSYLPENLASRGYVVVAIDHTDSTHSDRGGPRSFLPVSPQEVDHFVL